MKTWKVVRYFQELLKTLKSIETELKCLSECTTHSNYKNRRSIVTQDWNSFG